MRDRLDLHIVNTKEQIPDDLASKAEIFVSHKHGGALKRMHFTCQECGFYAGR